MLVCVFFCASLHTRPRVQRAPGIPCALFYLGAKVFSHDPGASRRGIGKAYLSLTSRIVGWAKRSVPTSLVRSLLIGGGHGASAPLPTLRNLTGRSGIPGA